MKQWKKEYCAGRPEELQIIAPGIYIQRRNICLDEQMEMGDRAIYSGYVCESREISVSEYEMLKSIEEIRTDKAVAEAIDEYTMQLMEGGLL